MNEREAVHIESAVQRDSDVVIEPRILSKIRPQADGGRADVEQADVVGKCAP